MHAIPRVSSRLRIPGILASLFLLTGCGERLDEYVSDEGRFRVLLPGEPSTTRDPELPKSVHKVGIVLRSGSYAVAWEDLQDEVDDPDKRLDMACQGALKSLKAKELSRKSIRLPGGEPGRDLIAEWPDGMGVVHHRMYLVGRRLYHVVVSGSRWWVESNTSRRVLDSFRLVDDDGG